MGILTSRAQIQQFMDQLRWAVLVSRFEPDVLTWPFPHQFKLTFGRRTRQPNQYPAYGGWGSGGDETILCNGLLKAMRSIGSSTWIRQD